LHPEIKDGVFSFMVMETLNPIMAGIVISAVLAAAMSSANCLLVALGATFSRDFYNKVLHPNEKLDDLPRGKTVAQVTVLLSAIVGILLSFKITNILDAIIIFNYPYMGSLLVPLVIGILWKGATRKGAFYSMVVGGIIGVVSFFAGIPSPISGLLNPDLGLFYAYIASFVVLYLTSKNDVEGQSRISQIK